MAITFNGTSTNFDMGNDVSVRPGTSHFNAAWVRATNAALHYIISNYNPAGSSGSPNSNSMWMDGSGRYRGAMRGSTGGSRSLVTDAFLGADGIWRLWVFQRNDTSGNVELIYCEPGGTPVVKSVAIGDLGAISNAYPTVIGSNPATTAGNYWTGDIAEVFSGDTALTTEQIANMADGGHPQYQGVDLRFYHPMRVTDTTLYDVRGQFDATGQDGATTEHPYIQDRGHGQGRALLVPGSPAPAPSDIVLDLTNTGTFDVPAGFNDTVGTIYLEGPTAGGTVRTAYAWDGSGFQSSTGGAIAEYDQWPIPFVEPLQTNPQNTYYVDSTAPGGGDGSQGNPWNDLGDIPALVAGDTVIFVDGSIFTGTLDVTESGAQDNVIKYTRSGGGDKPVIQGDGATTDYCMQIYAEKYIWVDGIEFRNAGYGTNTEADGQIRITGGNETTLLTDYIWLTNCDIHDSAGSGGYMNDFVHHFTMHNCNVYDIPYNGWLFNSGDQNTDAFNVLRETNFWNCCSLNAGDHVVNGIGGNTVVFGCTFDSNDTNDHNLYRGHTPPGARDEWYGAVRVFECRFTLGTGALRSSYPLGMKGQGLHAYRLWTSETKQWSYCAQLASGTGNLGNFGLHDLHHSIATDVDEVAPSNEAHCIGISNITGTGPNERPDAEADYHIWNVTCSDSSWAFHVDATNMEIEASVYVTTNCIAVNMTSGGARLQKDTGFTTLKWDYNWYGDDVTDNFAVPADATNTFVQWQGLNANYDPNSTFGVDPLLTDPGNVVVTNRDFSLQAGSPAKNAGSWTDMRRLDDINAHVGYNYCFTTVPSVGAYEYIAGTQGNRANPILAQAWTGDWTIVRLHSTKHTEAQLNVWTGA